MPVGPESAEIKTTDTTNFHPGDGPDLIPLPQVKFLPEISGRDFTYIFLYPVKRACDLVGSEKCYEYRSYAGNDNNNRKEKRRREYVKQEFLSMPGSLLLVASTP